MYHVKPKLGHRVDHLCSIACIIGCLIREPSPAISRLIRGEGQRATSRRLFLRGAGSRGCKSNR
jgi:hypothetical protein